MSERRPTKNQYSRIYQYLAFEVYGFKKICEKCNSKDNIHVHHKDKNRKNNDKNNLQILCCKCHISYHFKGENNPFFGKKLSKKHRLNISKNNSRYWLGKNLSEKHKNKLSKIKKGKKLSEEHKKNLSINSHNKKNIIQYDLNNKFIKKWDSAKQAGEQLKIHRGQIGGVCKGYGKTAGGYIWKYLNN